MKKIKTIGLIVFILGLGVFTILPFLGEFKLSEEEIELYLSPEQKENIGEEVKNQIANQSFSNATVFSHKIISIYKKKNNEFKANQEWDKVMWTQPSEFALFLSQKANKGIVNQNQWLFFFLTFGLGIIGSLMYILSGLVLLGPAGIKNNGIYHDSSTNRGWIGIITFVYLVSFYIILYFYPYIMTNQMVILNPIKQWFIATENASQWFLYGFLYCAAMLVMGIKMIIKYRHSKYQIVRTISVLFFQIIFAFLMVEILPAFGLPGVDFKNAWPLDYDFLFDWNIKELLAAGMFGKFAFIWGVILTIILVPLLTYFYGKRWYCSWVCGCGGLAETLGDPYRQLSNKKMYAWKIERWMIHLVLVFAVVMTIFTGYHTYQEVYHPTNEEKDILFGLSAFDIRQVYSFLIGSIFAGVIGTGFYPIFGNRTWCRFGCPLAAYLGLVQRFKSRFRITTNGGQCISCGNCSTYCEQGIDVRAYAQKGQNIVRSSCVGCGICAAVCPRGVLKLENGPEKNRFGNEGPIVLGNNGFELEEEK